MTLLINGTDILPYVVTNGIKWGRSDLDSPKAGRTLDGIMHRGRIATKIRLDITCRPLTQEQASIVLNLIQPEYVTVTYDDPLQGRVVKPMYANNNSCKLVCVYDDDETLWDGIEFPLIEV